jgi:transcriptional regulator with XRE-family HTH domain
VDSTITEVANAIRALRLSAGLSKPQLAIRAGVPLSTVYLFEDGLLDARITTVMKLARALNVTPDYLLGLRRAVV